MGKEETLKTREEEEAAEFDLATFFEDYGKEEQLDKDVNGIEDEDKESDVEVFDLSALFEEDLTMKRAQEAHPNQSSLAIEESVNEFSKEFSYEDAASIEVFDLSVFENALEKEASTIDFDLRRPSARETRAGHDVVLYYTAPTAPDNDKEYFDFERKTEIEICSARMSGARTRASVRRLRGLRAWTRAVTNRTNPRSKINRGTELPHGPKYRPSTISEPPLLEDTRDKLFENSSSNEEQWRIRFTGTTPELHQRYTPNSGRALKNMCRWSV
ncbi:hypothetical protein Sste5346_009640 [Sporothrix stenoceras]|uniref:Uncharacterized protein n=1 Tax=Sporothrix stenoceras TaxID=5173 RepID=A0ABR3YK32_9PEZI